jgi:hypothetical protein
MWWFADKTRLARELRGLTDLTGEGWLTLGEWSVKEVDLQVLVTVRAAGVDYLLRLVFPCYFPHVPAWVAPTDDERRLSEHQFGPGGSLCLELGADNWTPQMSGVDILRSAHKLLSTENPRGEGEHGEVEDGHRDAPFQVGVEQYSVLADEAVLDRLKAGLLFDPRALRWWPPGVGWPVFLHDGRSRQEGTVPPTHTWLDGFMDLPVFQTSQPGPRGDITRIELINAGGFADDARLALEAADRALLIFGVGATPEAFAFEKDKAHRLWWLPLKTEAGVRSGAPPERGRARVALVGAGSVGSKLAEILVRSGVRDLTLIDGDIFLPANLERNALDWRDVGGRKVDAVKARLLLIAPQVQVSVEAKDLAWQTSSRNHAATVASIGRCDVIIDATGDPGSSLMLGGLAASAKKPFVSVEVLEGGIGVLVAACLPSRDPSYAQARANFLAWCEQEGFAFATPAVRYGGVDAEGAPIVADDTAATVAAGHAGRTILDIVDGKATSRSRAWQLIGLSEAWVFGRHGPSIGIDVGQPDPPPPPADAQTEAFVQARFKEIFDALTPAG